jgi:hypothetical protein
MFSTRPDDAVYLSRYDANHPLASHAPYAFELDGAEWPSAEHYLQAMLLEDPELRERVRRAPHPKDAEKLVKRHKRALRNDWKALRQTLMTRALYTICRTHPEVSRALLQTGERRIIENTQFDYYWGCGRDGRGENAYGTLLMGIRDKLRQTD